MAKQQRRLIVSTVSCFELGEFASLVLGQLEIEINQAYEEGM